MKGTYLKITVNSILFSILTFFIVFVILNYFLPRAWAVGISFTLSAITPILVVKTGISAQKKSDQKSCRLKKTERVVNGLCFLSQTEVLSLFKNAYQKSGAGVSVKSGAILKDDNTAVFFRFSFDGLSKTEVVKIFNKLPRGYDAQIFAYSFTDEVKKFSERFDGRITLLGGNDAFSFLENAGALPTDLESPLTREKPKKASLKGFLDRKKAKSFLRFGLFFSFFSFFTPFKLYYIIFGTALSLFAIAVMIFIPRTEN